MLLVIDVGNTNTVLGVYGGAHLLHQWRISTSERTDDELGVLMTQLFAHERVERSAITGVAVCTVVPAALRAIDGACRRYLNRVPRVFDSAADNGIDVRVANASTLGPDRLVNVFAARLRFPPPFLVVDFGTATTFDCVAADGAFVGGAIAPGLRICADALFSRTSRLPRVDLKPPASPVATDTVSAIQSGLFWGYVGLVDGLAHRCKQELAAGGHHRVPCVATGGLARVVAGACTEIDEVDDHLTLDGLRIWFER